MDKYTYILYSQHICNVHLSFLCIPVWIAVLIDAIVKNGSTSSAGADHVPPPPGWRDEDIGGRETTFNTSSDEKKTYTEEQRQGVTRCSIFTLLHHRRVTLLWTWNLPSSVTFRHQTLARVSLHALLFAGLRTVRTFMRFWAFLKTPAKKIWRRRTGSWLWSFTPTRTSLREPRMLSKVPACAAATPELPFVNVKTS